MRTVVVCLCVAACGGGGPGGGGGGDASPSGGTYAVESFGLTGQMANVEYSGPVVSVDGARVFAVGNAIFQVPPNSMRAGHVLSSLDGTQLRFAEELAYPTDTGDGVMSSVVSDGAGGVFVGVNRIAPDSSTLPAVVHVDASGQVVWSKTYASDAVGWSLPSYGDNPNPVLSAVVDGKLAVVVLRQVMVIDTEGAVQWTSRITTSPATNYSQVYADAAGVIAWGIHNDKLVVVQYDWTGAVVAYKEAFADVHGPTKLGPPFLRADGELVMGYDTQNKFAAATSGVLVFDRDGTLHETTGYGLQAEWDLAGFDRGLSAVSRIRYLGDDLVTFHSQYETGANEPFTPIDVDLVFRDDAAGEVADLTFSAAENATWFGVQGGAYGIGQFRIATGDLGGACGTDTITTTAVMKRSTGLQFDPLADAAYAPTTFTTMPVDDPVTVSPLADVHGMDVTGQGCR